MSLRRTASPGAVGGAPRFASHVDLLEHQVAVAVLDGLVAVRGQAPEHVRCDNGPELTANALRDWCRFSRAATSYIEPGSP